MARLAVLLLLVFLLAPIHPRPVSAAGPDEWEAELQRLTNSDRTSNGRPALLPSAPLYEVARGRSTDMLNRQYFSHYIPPDGNTVQAIIDQRGIPYKIFGENIGYSSGHDSDIVAYLEELWLESPGHRQNIMDPRFTHLGLGAAMGSYRDHDDVKMFTEVFTQVAGAAAAPTQAPEPPAPTDTPVPPPAPTDTPVPPPPAPTDTPVPPPPAPTDTPVPLPPPTDTPVPPPAPTDTPLPPAPTDTPAPTATALPSETPTGLATTTPTVTETPTATLTETHTTTPTGTPTATGTPGATRTSTIVPTLALTPRQPSAYIADATPIQDPGDPGAVGGGLTEGSATPDIGATPTALPLLPPTSSSTDQTTEQAGRGLFDEIIDRFLRVLLNF